MVGYGMGTASQVGLWYGTVHLYRTVPVHYSTVLLYRTLSSYMEDLLQNESTTYIELMF